MRQVKAVRDWGLTRTAMLLAVVFLSGCMQVMSRQPKFKPLRPSAFFDDGRSARPLVPGTVARDHLEDDVPFYTGRRGRTRQPPQAGNVVALLAGGGGVGNLAAVGLNLSANPYVDEFPLPLTTPVLERGRERYNIFCAVCHDRAGTGNGMIPRRGFTHPPSFHTDYSRGLRRQGIKVLLRQAPVGYYYDVITNGYGAMADYSAQVPPRDRWAIIPYIRALQLSRQGRGGLQPQGQKK
jgi:hypothetical protein